MRFAIVVAALLTVGVGFSVQAQTFSAAAPVTVLALAPPAPLPATVAGLAAPVPAAYTAPATAARPTDGLRTTQLILGIAASAVALVAAIVAISR